MAARALNTAVCFDDGRPASEEQRLRRIHQLGVSNFTYPGADRTRLAHSLGVADLMKLALHHLERVSDAEKIKDARQPLLCGRVGRRDRLRFTPCRG